jgi:hypothetical protein
MELGNFLLMTEPFFHCFLRIRPLIPVINLEMILIQNPIEYDRI